MHSTYCWRGRLVGKLSAIKRDCNNLSAVSASRWYSLNKEEVSKNIFIVHAFAPPQLHR